MSSRKPAIEILRDETGEAVGPDLIQAIQSLPVERLETIAERALNDDTFIDTTPKTTDVWPVITLRSSVFMYGGLYADSQNPAGVNLMDAWNPRKQGTGLWSDAIMRTLLYSHGMTIEDPLCATLELFLNAPTDARRPLANSVLITAVTSIAEIYPLITDGIVTTFFMAKDELDASKQLGGRIMERLGAAESTISEDDVWNAFEKNFVNSLSPSLQTLWKEIRGGNRSPDIELLKSGIKEDGKRIARIFLDAVENIDKTAVVSDMADSIATTLVANDSLGWNYDILCPSEMSAALLFMGAPDPIEELRVHELGSIDVPGIQGLSTSDAISIRRNSDSLDKWRTDLSVALDGAKRLRDKHGITFDTSEFVAETMQSAHETLLRTAKRSKAFTAKTLINYAIGMLGALAPNTIEGILYGMGAATAATIFQTAAEKVRIPDYLNRHYLVFRKPNG
jgi:hypothetical protein